MLQQQGNNKPFIPEENAAASASELARGEREECQPDGRSEKPEREREGSGKIFRSVLSVIFRDGENRDRERGNDYVRQSIP